MSVRSFLQKCSFASVVSLFAAPAAFGGAFATSAFDYAPGSNPVSGFTNPNNAVGAPERFTGEGVFPGAVTPFNPPYGTDELVSIGSGGSITFRFDQPVTDNPANPFGIDLLIFGNAGLIDGDFPNGLAVGSFSTSAGGRVELSVDGSAWITVPGFEPVGRTATLGYSDLTDPFALSPGSVLSDFSRPVNPAFNPIGMTFAQIVAAYNGSGGGTGLDLASVGLSSAQFIRISNTGSAAFQIDAVSAVPSPASLVLGAVAMTFTRRRRESVG